MTCHWNSLPDHIIISILSHLPLVDRYKASLTCSSWAHCFDSRYLWTDFDFVFAGPHDERLIRCVELHGACLKSVSIDVDQSVAENRTNACRVITLLSRTTERRLRKLRVQFTGKNPYFYGGREFLTTLGDLFGSSHGAGQLTVVDMHGMLVSINDELMDVLSTNERHIERLHIENGVFVCGVTPACLLRLVERCRRLADLHVFSSSVSDDVLLAFAADDRAALGHLSMLCRREQKYGGDMSNDVWQIVRRKLPHLGVSIEFDQTCPPHTVASILKRDVPVSRLQLETFTYVYDDVRQAANRYGDTLETLVLLSPISRNAPELNSALVELASCCHRLRAMHVFCVLNPGTIDAILKLRPAMQRSNTFTLRSEQGQSPWQANYVYDDCPRW